MSTCPNCLGAIDQPCALCFTFGAHDGPCQHSSTPAQELAAILGISVNEATQELAAQVAVAGWPEGGAGMVSSAEWSDRQMALLSAAAQAGDL